jgi:hypothetical protein
VGSFELRGLFPNVGVGCSDAELLGEQLVLEWGIQRGGELYVPDPEHGESK